jgi:hypothetical protein
LSRHSIGYIAAFVIVYLRFISLKTKNNVKNTLFASIPVRNGKNNRKLGEDCFVIRRIVKIFCRDNPKSTKWPKGLQRGAN